MAGEKKYPNWSPEKWNGHVNLPLVPWWFNFPGPPKDPNFCSAFGGPGAFGPLVYNFDPYPGCNANITVMSKPNTSLLIWSTP